MLLPEDKVRITAVGPGGGGALGTRVPSWSNFFHFHAVFGNKLGQIIGSWEYSFHALGYNGIKSEQLTQPPARGVSRMK